MGSVVVERAAANETGFVPWQRAVEILGATSRATLYSPKVRQVRTVEVKPARGRRPEVWYSEDALRELRARGIGGSGAVAGRWKRVHAGESPKAAAPGMLGQVARLQEDGWLFTDDIARLVAELFGIPKPLPATVRKIPDAILRTHAGPGHYRRCRRQDFEAAEPDLRRWFLRQVPGYVSVAQAARDAGTVEKTITEAVRVGRVEALRDRKPMLVNEASLKRYLDRRPTTSPAMRDQLRQRGQLTLDDSAERLGVDAGCLRAGWKAGFLEPELLQVGRRSLPVFTVAALDALAAQRPACACGCGEMAWPWWTFVARHHLRLPAMVRVFHARKLAKREFFNAPPGSTERVIWAERARGLCEARRRANVPRRGRQDADSGRRITDESLEVYAELVIGRANGESLTQVATLLTEQFGRRVTRKQLDERRKQLEEIGRFHESTCKSCQVFGRYV